jgi:hypothetical protein
MQKRNLYSIFFEIHHFRGLTQLNLSFFRLGQKKNHPQLIGL